MRSNDAKTIDDALSEAAAEIALKGVGKTGFNQQQNYRFRGIDDVLNSVGPMLAKRGISVTARFSDRSSERVQTKSGSTLNFVVITGEFTYWWRDQHRTTVTIGEAMDSADKATNKAMAMAAKYAHVLTFSIPLIGSDDADLRSHAMGSTNGAAADLADKRLAAIEPAAPPAEEASDVQTAATCSRPLSTYAQTASGVKSYLKGVEAELMLAATNPALAEKIMEFHAADMNAIEKRALESKNKDASIISGNVSALREFASQIIDPSGDPDRLKILLGA